MYSHHAALCGSGGERAEDCYSEFITPLGWKARTRGPSGILFFIIEYALLSSAQYKRHRYYLTRVEMIQKVRSTDVLLVSALEKDVRLCAV